ncbi:MAG: hypothetical protein OXF97_10805 [Nitrospira sp.]|nr:hypothetical protein [Nitrospira sp.]
MPQETSLKKLNTANYRHKLRAACEWLNIGQGRAAAYRRLLDEFEKGSRSDEHILAYYESYEIVELFELWERRVDEFPGLKKKIRKVCKKGPVLREDETMNALSNRPRNDAFCFLAAGKFLAADISVVRVDGIASRKATSESNADFTFRWEESYIDVECKRLQSENQLLKRAEEARDQSTRSGYCGIVAIDCPVLGRPAGTVLENSAPDNAEFRLSEWLRTNIGPKIRSILSPKVLGLILFLRVPAMTSVGMISSRANFRRDSISSWLVVGNPDCSNPEILQKIALRLNNQAGSTLSGGESEGSDVSEH